MFENSISFIFHLSTYYYMYTKCKILLKVHACHAAAGVQNWGKMAYLTQQQGPCLEISYILLFSVITLHYYRLYQISSLEGKVYKI